MLGEVARRLAAAGDPGIFISLFAHADLEREAAALGAFDPTAKPLWGIPVAVKDNIDVLGLPTTAGCPDYAYRPTEDAEAVARLRRAGALIVGKTNLDQFATGLVGVRTPYPVPRNACDPALVPGGSSSGSAVAVARGIVCAGARHRHRRLGPRSGGAEQHRRAEADARRRLDARRRAGLPHARLRLGVRADRRGCVGGLLPRWPAMTRSIRSRATCRRPIFERTTSGASRGRPGCRRHENSSATRSAEAAFDAALAKLESLGASIVPLPFADFYAAAALLYEGAWVAERYAAIREVVERAAGHPASGHAPDHRGRDEA